jgi:uncharacterized oxidoreductase
MLAWQIHGVTTMGNFRLCPPQPLEQFAAAVFRTLGADEEVAAEVARHLVRSNLSGHDSHGVIRIMQYVTQTEAGEIRPSARPVMLRENGATALIDAQRSMGHYSTAFALDWAMARAAEHGVAAAAVRHFTHIGRVGEYTERDAARGLIAIVTVGACGPGGAAWCCSACARSFSAQIRGRSASPAAARCP